MFNLFRRATPEEKERARCNALARMSPDKCRGIEGQVIDFNETTLFFSYEVRGVIYNASQDLSVYPGAVPQDPGCLLGPVTVRYSTLNPANSLIVASDWSGFRGEKSVILNTIRKAAMALVLVGALLGGQAAFAAAKPKSVIHVINVKFKADAKKADIDAAIAGIETIAGKYKGIKNVWLRPIKVQGGAGGFTHCLVMEFESEDALKKYTGSPEQLAWYKLWEPVRELSNTHDVTN
jgi:hypothetical protein